MLETLGLKVQYATNGEEAASTVFASGKDFAFVLMDFQMPVMDGLAATQTIRAASKQDPWLNNVPIILLTADIVSSEELSRCGLDAYLSKPVSLASLKDLLDNITNDKSLWLRNGFRCKR